MTLDIANFGPISEAAVHDEKEWKAMLKALEALRDEEV